MFLFVYNSLVCSVPYIQSTDHVAGTKWCHEIFIFMKILASSCLLHLVSYFCFSNPKADT
jgi:hypothetical protein